MAVIRLVYEPAGADRQEWDFDVDNPLNLEAEAVERAGGEIWDSYPDFLDKISRGNTTAKRAMLWTMLRRSDPKVRFVDVVFNLGEFYIESIEDDEPEPVGKDSSDDDDTALPSPRPDSAASPSNSAGMSIRPMPLATGSTDTEV